MGLLKTRYKVMLGILALLLAAGAAYLFAPLGDPDLSADPLPRLSYSHAVGLMEETRLFEEGLDLSETGGSMAMLQGSRTPTSVVILHGYTATPWPFRHIAQAYSDMGYNVWVPRAPFHGYADKMTEAPSRLTPRLLRDYADRAIQVGAGLGEHVIVIGQSGGGTLAMRALAEHEEVAQAYAISPFMHPKEDLPVWAMRPMARWLAVAPDAYRWWDEELKDTPAGLAKSPNAYPRGSLRGMTAYLMTGLWLRDVRSGGDDPAGRLTLVLNDGDPSIDGPYAREVAEGLVPAGQLTVYTIPASDKLEHDLVDPQDRNKDRIGVAYSHLSKALGVKLPDPKG